MNDELIHYGIKGMKWGIRRTPEQLGHRTFKSSGRTSLFGKKKTSSDPKNSNSSSSLPKQSVKSLSDEELRARISRLELEKKYKELTTAKKTTSRGKKFCVDVLESIGKNTLTNLGTQAANHIIGNAINKVAGVDSNDAARRVVNPQRGQTDKK